MNIDSASINSYSFCQGKLYRIIWWNRDLSIKLSYRIALYANPFDTLKEIGHVKERDYIFFLEKHHLNERILWLKVICNDSIGWLVLPHDAVVEEVKCEIDQAAHVHAQDSATEVSNISNE